MGCLQLQYRRIARHVNDSSFIMDFLTTESEVRALCDLVCEEYLKTDDLIMKKVIELVKISRSKVLDTDLDTHCKLLE